MPRIRSDSTRRAVRARSSGEGAGSPLGWLWPQTTAAARSRTAALNTSRGSTAVPASVPLDTVISRRSLCFVSTRKEAELLVRQPRHGWSQEFIDIRSAVEGGFTVCIAAAKPPGDFQGRLSAERLWRGPRL